jgi:hypothetical protein
VNWEVEDAIRENVVIEVNEVTYLPKVKEVAELNETREVKWVKVGMEASEAIWVFGANGVIGECEVPGASEVK